MRKLATGLGVVLILTAALVIINNAGEQAEDDDSEPSRSRSRAKGSKTTDRIVAQSQQSKSSCERGRKEDSKPIFSGPHGLAGWVQFSSAKELADAELPWEFVDGKLVTRSGGAIAREIAMPPRAKMSFQLAWRESESLRFRTSRCNPGPAPSRTVEPPRPWRRSRRGSSGSRP